MKRRLFNLASALSAVLFVMVIALDVVSRWRAGSVMHFVQGQRSDGRSWARSSALGIVRGEMFFTRSSREFTNPSDVRPRQLNSTWRTVWTPPSPTARLSTSWSGFEWTHRQLGSAKVQTSSVRVVWPTWSMIAAFAILPAMKAWQWWRRRVPVGHCAQCGYDLRATPERCPECGMVPKDASATAA